MKEELDLDFIAGELATRLTHALGPFLNKHLVNTTNLESLRAWRKDLHKVFVSAINLKKAVLLSDNKFTFLWPSAGECSNHRTMKTDNGSYVERDRKVRIGLFPALLPAWEPSTTLDRSRERSVFPAIVTLQ